MRDRTGPPAQTTAGSEPRAADTSFIRLRLHLHGPSVSPWSLFLSTGTTPSSPVHSETESQISWDYTRLHVLCNPGPVRITNHNIRAGQPQFESIIQDITMGVAVSGSLLYCDVQDDTVVYHLTINVSMGILV